MGDLEKFYKLYTLAVKKGWSRENLAEYLGITSDSVRRKIVKTENSFGITLAKIPMILSKLTSDMVNELNAELNSTEVTKSCNKSSVFVITSAQNATPIHKGFFDSIIRYCNYRNAELLVIPYRYKNPTSLWSESAKNDDWWATHVEDYLITSRIRLADNLVIMGDIKIQPTASDPISGFEGFSGGDSVILGHPKVRLSSVPTLNGLSKLLLTTGSVTVPNYTDSKVGQKAKFHHSLAATIVEVNEDGLFFVRHIHASNNGSFYDLDTLYTPKEVIRENRVEALIAGDVHAEFIDEQVEEITFNSSDSIVSVLRPKKVILHDVLDFGRRNHHAIGKDVLSYGKHHYGRDNVQEELQITADFIDRISKKDQEVIIVKSNHDEAFAKWLMISDPKFDPENADLYYYMKYHQMKSVKRTDTGFSSFDPFKFWCHNPESGVGLRNKKSTRFLRRDESVRICGIEVGFHGDVGADGSRGEIKGFSKLSDKIIVGHRHSPSIYESAYQVGLSCKKNLEYTRGPSSWMHTHCIIYPDGKRTLLHIINGKWKI